MSKHSVKGGFLLWFGGRHCHHGVDRGDGRGLRGGRWCVVGSLVSRTNGGTLECPIDGIDDGSGHRGGGRAKRTFIYYVSTLFEHFRALLDTFGHSGHFWTILDTFWHFRRLFPIFDSSPLKSAYVIYEWYLMEDRPLEVALVGISVGMTSWSGTLHIKVNSL